MSPRPWLRSYAHHVPAAVAAAALALTTSPPLSALPEPDTYGTPERVTRVEHALSRIPDGATVEADIGPLSRLTSRCRVFWVGNTRGITPEYMALNNTGHWIHDIEAYTRQLHPHARYTIVDAAHGYVILKRSG